MWSGLVQKDKIKANILKKDTNKMKISCPNCRNIYKFIKDKLFPIKDF